MENIIKHNKGSSNLSTQNFRAESTSNTKLLPEQDKNSAKLFLQEHSEADITTQLSYIRSLRLSEDVSVLEIKGNFMKMPVMFSRCLEENLENHFPKNRKDYYKYFNNGGYGYNNPAVIHSKLPFRKIKVYFNKSAKDIDVIKYVLNTTFDVICNHSSDIDFLKIEKWLSSKDCLLDKKINIYLFDSQEQYKMLSSVDQMGIKSAFNYEGLKDTDVIYISSENIYDISHQITHSVLREYRYQVHNISYSNTNECADLMEESLCNYLASIVKSNMQPNSSEIYMRKLYDNQASNLNISKMNDLYSIYSFNENLSSELRILGLYLTIFLIENNMDHKDKVLTNNRKDIEDIEKMYSSFKKWIRNTSNTKLIEIISSKVMNKNLDIENLYLHYYDYENIVYDEASYLFSCMLKSGLEVLQELNKIPIEKSSMGFFNTKERAICYIKNILKFEDYIDRCRETCNNLTEKNKCREQIDILLMHFFYNHNKHMVENFINAICTKNKEDCDYIRKYIFDEKNLKKFFRHTSKV